MRFDRRRLLWSFAASTTINVIVWAACGTHFPVRGFEAQSPREKLVISMSKIRIEHRRSPQPRPTAPTEEPPPSFLGPPQPAALALPQGWKRQDFGNIAETDTTIWVDWKKQTPNFVPRVFLWQKKIDANAGYMHRPSLNDAVAEVLTSLHADDAEIYISRSERVCNGERAGWYLSYVKRDDDPPLRFDETVFLVDQTIFRATYIRRADQAEDPETRKALDTLCA
jgi:hypothetical protein